MWPAFPASDYYGASAPSRGHQPTAGLPVDPPWLGGDEGGPGMVPMFTASRSTGSAPSSSPAASPRLRRRPSPWPPRRPLKAGFGVAVPTVGDDVHCGPAHIHQVGAGSSLEGVQPLVSAFVHLPVLLAGPRPSGSADPSRLCQGCSHPSLRLQGQAALSFTCLLRQAGGGVLSSPPGITAPHGALNGRCGIRLAPGDRRPRRRQGRPLCSSLGPWPSIDGRRRCEKSRVGGR